MHSQNSRARSRSLSYTARRAASALGPRLPLPRRRTALSRRRPSLPLIGNGQKFPTWAVAARIMFAMTPNSASAERVFSLLKAMFGDARASSLSDLIEGSLMLKFNKAKRKAEKEMMEQAAGPN